MESANDSKAEPFLSNMPNSPSRGSGNALDKTASQYERKLARQRQLEQMEAAASGVAVSMQLDGLSDGSTGIRSRNEAARRFLHDEDELNSVNSSKSPNSSHNIKPKMKQPLSPIRNTTGKSIFDVRGRPDGLAQPSGVNLMDYTRL
jgi:hypothetical protein